jgi:CRISPR system Cascade subunit CasD
MKTLLLRLVGPMQSWGTQSRYTIRETNLEPSKSGVIGLIYSALGKKRTEEDIDDPEKPSLKRLAALRMGVRIDCPGVMLSDYHTIGGAPPTKTKKGLYLASGKIDKNDARESRRYYLSDAKFLVGLESGDENLIALLHQKIARPKQQIFLGRKSFVPSEPVWLENGLSDSSLEFALKNHNWLGQDEQLDFDEKIVCVMETTSNDPMGIVRQDVPISFAARRFTNRRVRTEFINLSEN